MYNYCKHLKFLSRVNVFHLPHTQEQRPCDCSRELTSKRVLSLSMLKSLPVFQDVGNESALATPNL